MQEVKLGKTITEIHEILETLYDYEAVLVCESSNC
jgi:hypothetical protein